MKLAFVILLACGNVYAVGPVTIKNPATSAITSVKTLVWGFKKGDIAHYPQPTYLGTPLTTWQDDQVRRWSDGSVKVAIISFPIALAASESRVIDFVDAGTCATTCGPNDNRASSTGSGMTSAQMRDFSTWNAAADLTYNDPTTGGNQRIDARRILTDDIGAGKSCGSAGARCTYWLNGPVVTEMILQGPLDDQAHFFDYTIGFDQGHGGNNRPIRPRFEIRAYPSWPTGVREVVTILADMSTRLEHQSFNYQVLNGSGLTHLVYPAAPPSDDCTSITSCAMILNATTTLRKVAWDGTAPPPVDTTDHNMQYKADSGLFPNWNVANIAAAGGIAPGAITYWQGQWASSDQCLDASDRGTLTQNFNTQGGRWDLGPTPHIHSLALFAPQALSYVALGESGCSMNLPFHLLDTRLDSGTPYTYCPLTCTGANASALAFGRFPSPENRPTFLTGLYGTCWDFVGNTPVVAAGDKITPIYFPDTATVNGWKLDLPHHPDLWYASFFLSDGDYFWYSELMQWAMYSLGEVPASANVSYVHHFNWAASTYRALQTRGYAWAHRTRGSAMTLIDQNDPTYQMLGKHWEIDARVGEGAIVLTTGNYPPTDSTCASFNESTSNNPFSDDAWCWGKLTVGRDNNSDVGPSYLNSTYNLLPIAGPFRGANKAANQPINFSPTGGSVVGVYPPWQAHYKEIVAYWNMHRELGYESAIYTAEAKGEMSLMMSPGHSRWLAAEVDAPMLIDDGVHGPGAGTGADATIPGKFITTTAEWRNAWANGHVDVPSVCTTSPPNAPFNFDMTFWRCTGYYSGPGVSHTQETYVYIYSATVAGWVGLSTTAFDGTTTLTGQDTWNWLQTPGVVPAKWNEDPRYSIVPYGPPVTIPPPGTCACTAAAARRQAAPPAKKAAVRKK